MLIAELEYKLDDRIFTQRTLRLRVGVSDIRRVMDRAAKQLRDKGETVPGFRPGRGPLALYLRHFKERIEVNAFDELRREAVQQVLKQIGDQHQPMLPPEVLDRDKVRLSYNKPLEFSVKYFVDPTGIDANPETPRFKPMSPVGGTLAGGRSLPLGISRGPKMPRPPQIPKQGPKMPSMPKPPSSNTRQDKP